MNLLPKYDKPPTCPLPQEMIAKGNIPYQMAFHQFREQLEDVDLWLQVDAGWYILFTDKPKGKLVHVATDPHCLVYDTQRKQSDFFLNMQKFYSRNGDLYLPYAADSECHMPLEVEKEYDVCMIGLHYAHRNRLVNLLKGRGLKVYYEIGHIYEEYQELYAKSRVAVSWASLKDLPARVFENMLMAVPLVTNRVPDLSTHFVEDEHYLGFDTAEEAVEKVMWALENEELANKIAWNAHRKVKALHLWKHRIDTILEISGLNRFK
jgi:spore maturation protein CgeB